MQILREVIHVGKNTAQREIHEARAYVWGEQPTRREPLTLQD